MGRNWEKWGKSGRNRENVGEMGANGGKTGSVTGTRRGEERRELGGVHCTVSKAAVLGVTRHFAREAASYNINVNGVCPALIDTPMVRETTTPTALARFIQAIPMGRLGQSEEEARPVLFLPSPAASYITGAIIEAS